MYLKEIEISGFKSFADKIDLNLDNKITCIVGPNGSGKSNIVDAIRFVLGEQSVKSLRGDNLMADVIFAGSKNRNPMHAASVSLTFDNSDNYLKLPYNQVSVKRRLYKTGENEYFLNGEKCRLKDIVDMFLDSGMGRDSFNIISQGEISKILSNSPLERRIVIEEAAGILKYKKRREEAFKKLDKTNNNIERVTDILNEVKERVEPLKKQSEKATLYLDFKKELETIEVALLATEIEKMNLTYQETKVKIKNLEESILFLQNKINDPEIENDKTKQLELEKKLDKMNQELIILNREKEELNSQRLLQKERSKYESLDLKVYENINYLTETKLRLENELILLGKELDNLQNNLAIKEEDNKALKNNLESEKTKRENLNHEYLAKNKEKMLNFNRLEILNHNLKDNAYLPTNIKKILDNPKLTGVLNPIINIVKTSDYYQKCLDVALMVNKNYLIVETESDAKEAIQFLKMNELGRATFLPLNVMKPKYVDSKTKEILVNQEGYLGLLSDFLEYDKLYENIILNQFGNTIVVNTLDNGNKITKLMQNRYRIITIGGEVIQVGGSIVGGSLNQTKNLANLNKEITDLNLKLTLDEEVLRNLENDIEKVDSNIATLETKLYENKANLNDIETSINNIEKNYETIQNELKNTTLELNSLDKKEGEEEKLNQAYYEKTLAIDLLEKDMKTSQVLKENLKQRILEKEGIIKINRQELQTKEKELKDLEFLLHKLDIKLDNCLNTLNQEYNLTYEKARSDYYLEISLDEARGKVQRLKDKLKEIGMVNLDSIKEYEEVSERYNFLNCEYTDLLKAKDMLYTLISEMDEVMQDEFLKTFNQLEIEFKKVFREMFKGGEATLKLTDPNNLLETGVEIIASPPGKKLKTITLLSGGEKTLTAISLLFAILNIRSVPFCIFDEVEAALDEANVDNFGKYLDHYQDKTQFLLITHKKRTMEYAKTLYGITMQESGVSKLVSVKLEDSYN